MSEGPIMSSAASQEVTTKNRRDAGDLAGPTTSEVSSYVRDLLKSIRSLTKPSNRRDFEFLDYLLAMAEDEASALAARTYQ